MKFDFSQVIKDVNGADVIHVNHYTGIGRMTSVIVMR